MSEVKTAGLIFICFSMLHGFLAALNCTSPTPEALFDALEKEVFPKKDMLPVKSFSDTLNITVEMIVVGILGVNEKAQSLTFIWQVMEWNIAGLSWDRKECGTTKVSVPREKLWVPDILIAEFMDEDTSPKTPYVRLYNTGVVYEDKPIRVVSFCQLGIYTFPFDIQNCSLTFGSYLHFSGDIRTNPHISAEEILEESRNVIKTKGEWELIDIQVSLSTLEITSGSYSEITYFVILRRQQILYVMNLLIPSCFLITLDLFSFLLPPQSVDRSAFKMTLILGYSVFLLLMTDLLPVTGETAPLMNVFFMISFALMVTSLLETVFSTRIQSSSSHYSAVPHWLSLIMLRYLAVVVFLPSKKKTNRVTVSLHHPTGDPAKNINKISLKDPQDISADTSPENPPQDPALDELRKLSRDLIAICGHVDKHFLGTKTSQEWQMIGLVIDRLFLGLYVVFLTVSFSTIIIVWNRSNMY